MRDTRTRLDVHSEVNRRNRDRDIQFSEEQFRQKHASQRYEQIKRMVPKPGHEAEYAAIIARYEEELGVQA